MWFKQPLRLNAAMLKLNKQHCVKLAYLWMFIPLLLPQMSTPHGQESCLFNSVSLEPYVHIRYVIRIFFWPSCMACGILVHWPGIEPVSSAVESGNMWTAKEVQNFSWMNKWVSLIVLWIISEDLGFHLIFISNLANIDWTYGVSDTISGTEMNEIWCLASRKSKYRNNKVKNSRPNLAGSFFFLPFS